MPLTLSRVAEKPSSFTKQLTLQNGEIIIYRPLEATDVNMLADFLIGLSVETRRLSTFDGYNLTTAKELCDAICKYDKLRFVLENERKRIVGLIEFSFGIPDTDIERFAKFGIQLSEATACRFGPTLADDYQNKGLGGKVFPLITDIVQRFGKKRIILWGGVLSDNTRAIHYYEKNGFIRAGTFTDKDGNENLNMILELSKHKG